MLHPQFHFNIRAVGSLTAIACWLGLFLVGTGCQHTTTYSPSFLHRLFGHVHRVESTPVHSPPTYSLFVSPIFKSNTPRRVLMLESGPAPGNYEASQKMIVDLAAQIRLNGTFEIIAPPTLRLQAQMDNILQGKFDEREIAEISRQYNADAVAFLRVNDLNGHAPIRTSVTMAIVDSNETTVIFAIDGIWDTANPATRSEFVNYSAAQNYAKAFPSDLQLQSPRALFSFSAHQMAQAIQASVN